MTRLTELESRIERVAKLFSECHDLAIQSNAHITHPEFYARLSGMHNLLAPELESFSQGQGAKVASGKESYDSSTFGRRVSRRYNDGVLDQSSATERIEFQRSLQKVYSSSGTLNKENMAPPLPGFQDIERPLGQHVPLTYNFHETLFSRRIHRYCLEHAYSLFIDPHSDPEIIYRLFRLVGCIRDKAKMTPYFLKLVRAGIEEPLEIMAQPFYCIGGAGKHYPRKDDYGHSIYPLNMRLPGRVLGILPMAETSKEGESIGDRQSLLKLFGLDGEWFDCQDVQGYLEEKGAVLGQSLIFAEIRDTTLHQPTRSDDYSICGGLEWSLPIPRAVGNGNSGRNFYHYNDRPLSVDGIQTGNGLYKLPALTFLLT